MYVGTGCLSMIDGRHFCLNFYIFFKKFDYIFRFSGEGVRKFRNIHIKQHQELRLFDFQILYGKYRKFSLSSGSCTRMTSSSNQKDA